MKKADATLKFNGRVGFTKNAAARQATEPFTRLLCFAVFANSDGLFATVAPPSTEFSERRR
jgi:hypothetical protein